MSASLNSLVVRITQETRYKSMSSEDSESDSTSIESRVRYIMEDVIPRDGDVDIMKLAEETVINAGKKPSSKIEEINQNTMRDFSNTERFQLPTISDEDDASTNSKENLAPVESIPLVEGPEQEGKPTSISGQTDETCTQMKSKSHSNSSFTDSLDSISKSGDCSKTDQETTADCKSRKNQTQTTDEKCSSKIPKKNGADKKDQMPQIGSKAHGRNSKSRVRNRSIDSCMSSSDCLSIASVVTPIPKYNISSRKRFELGHASHDSNCDMNSYLTPTQRKEQQIKELKNQVKVMGKQLEDKERDIELLKSQLGQEAAKAFDQRTEQIQKVRDETIAIQIKNDQLSTDYAEAQDKLKLLQLDIDELKEDLKKKEEDQERMYLEMYKKGQQSAQFEREEDLQALLTRGVNNVGIRELARRLAWTECELAKWQTIQRKEVYESADKPSTEAAATLRFLKDSFFHYLTNEKDSDDHLRAMIRIFNYTEVQKKKVAKSLLEGKKLRK